jgi:CcdB protein
MSKQFDLYRTRDGDYVLILQSDQLEDLNTRAVCLAVPEKGNPKVFASLSPTLTAGDLHVVIAPHLLATLTLDELGRHVASLAHERVHIIRSMDLMLTGS